MKKPANQPTRTATMTEEVAGAVAEVLTERAYEAYEAAREFAGDGDKENAREALYQANLLRSAVNALYPTTGWESKWTYKSLSRG